MDFVRLGARYSTAYVPDMLIEGYTSLIWSERYDTHSDFELKTFDVDRMKSILPEDTLVSHLETREVLKVETHEVAMVGEGVDAVPELTIRGRSATTIFEGRWVEAQYKKTRRMRRKYNAAGAALVLIVNAVDNNSAKDITRGDTIWGDQFGENNDYGWTTMDVIPNVAVTDSVTSSLADRWWNLEQGPLWPQLEKILKDGDLGVRCLRPVRGLTPATVVTVATALENRGTIIRTAAPDVPQLRFDVYSGRDRSGSVKLSLLQNHLEKPQYMTSSQNYMSGVWIKSDGMTFPIVYRSGTSGHMGWRRKITELDVGSPEIPAAPEKPEELRKNATKQQREARADAVDRWIEKYALWKNRRDAIVLDFKTEALLAAEAILKEKRRINVFSADISELSPYKYGVHYNLGDLVSLTGEYGSSAKMIVSEYVRTEDASGDRGFPGLALP